MSGTTTDTLFFDGQCPLCLREMTHLRRLKDDALELVDIHSLPESGDLPPRDQLLAVLHLRRGQSWLTGVDASVAAWQHTRYAALWRWMRWPIIAPLIDTVYRRWAIWRFNRLYGKRCQPGGSCS